MKASIKPIIKQKSITSKTNLSKNQFSFAKSSRFPRPKENDDPKFLILPSTLSKKTCSFGLGKRKPLISKHCQDSPSPESYLMQSSFNSLNHSRDYSIETVKERKLFYIKPIPGPGSYNPSTPRRRRTPSCIISRTKRSLSTSITPTPCSYNPTYKSSKKNISFDISFTKSRKLSFIEEKLMNNEKISVKLSRRSKSLDFKKL